MTRKTTRRKFIISSVAVAGGIVGSTALHGRQSPSAARSPIAVPNTATMPERVLGKTGVTLPIFGLGGAGQTPISKAGQEAEAIAQIEAALKLGIRYFDTAASYGPSEDNMGKVLPPYRSKIFLATKTAKRDRDGAWQELERSLKRLNTDYLDSWQLHHVSFPETLDEIFSKNGAIKAIEEAKEQGIIKYSGITGHHEPDVIAEGLRRYPFDTTLISINAADIHHPRPFSKTVLPVAQEKNVGVIAMKIPAYGKLIRSGVLEGMHQAMGYVLSLSGVHGCIIAAETVEQLESNFKVAQAFKQLSSDEMAAIEKRTAVAWQENTFFRAWT
ncbi:MAG: aldo/keto reductase [Limnoraphis robusta]|uniref:Aldo/keto reductase n=1 Tax=Limnoraphis robusta CS-951 TaxID=1637645 RepID=A0A0F5YKE0_9CYAN|nr:aldo/keto reductase [Limnoraphis robusta]KKD38645.1 aldo/keto reductase [Limnoraphis robusta CS-951]